MPMHSYTTSGLPHDVVSICLCSNKHKHIFDKTIDQYSLIEQSGCVNTLKQMGLAGVTLIDTSNKIVKVY